MQSKADIPSELLESRAASQFVRAYFEFNHLKQLYRQGWLQRGLPPERCESVAEHTLGVVVLAWWLAESRFPGLDVDRVLRLALVHDFGEIFAGDFTPQDEVAPEEKSRLEEDAVRQVFGRLPQGEDYVSLWQEFESQESPEARFVRQIDRLEMAFQASVYEHQGFAPVNDFFASARRSVTQPELKEMLDELEDLRPAGDEN